ncbi:MAG TPA: penicillin-binding protein 1C, partial [Devosia sp.]|nr:penicillin-binding protein 1C [Devosia sp.]
SIYAAIARGGSPVLLHDGVKDAVPATDGAPVLDPVAAWYVTDILRDVPPPLNGAPGRIAYKTGTSYGYRDAWAIGYDGKTVVGVWVGRPDGAPVPGISGITAAAPILFESFDRLSNTTAPFAPAPDGVLFASNTELPLPLKRFRHPNAQVVAADASPEIAFPADGVDVDLGLADGSARPLIVKVRNGVPPYTFMANGAPFGRSAFARQESWTPNGPGYVTLSVIDAKGRSDKVTVFLN